MVSAPLPRRRKGQGLSKLLSTETPVSIEEAAQGEKGEVVAAAAAAAAASAAASEIINE